MEGMKSASTVWRKLIFFLLSGKLETCLWASASLSLGLTGTSWTSWWVLCPPEPGTTTGGGNVLLWGPSQKKGQTQSSINHSALHSFPCTIVTEQTTGKRPVTGGNIKPVDNYRVGFLPRSLAQARGSNQRPTCTDNKDTAIWCNVNPDTYCTVYTPIPLDGINTNKHNYNYDIIKISFTIIFVGSLSKHDVKSLQWGLQLSLQVEVFPEMWTGTTTQKECVLIQTHTEALFHHVCVTVELTVVGNCIVSRNCF